MKSISPATLTLVMLLAVGGLIAAYVAKKVFASEEGPPPVGVTNVPMALSDLEPGTLISEQHIGMGPLRNDKRERDTVTNKEILIGRVVKEPIKVAQPIKTGQLYPAGMRPKLEVREGMKAVSILLDDGPSIVDGLVQPGEYVDVHFAPDSVPTEVASYRAGFIMKLFDGVKLLAINRQTQASNVQRTSNTVTLELTPKQANVILLAQQKGVLNLALNNTGEGNGDIALDSEQRVTLEQILGIEPPTPPVAPFKMEVYHGSNRANYSFRDGKFDDGTPQENTRQYSPREVPSTAAPGRTASGSSDREPQREVTSPLDV